MTDPKSNGADETVRRRVKEAAQRALLEAEERRRQPLPEPVREVDGRGGAEPVRYGDWEVKGLATDF